MNIAAIFIRRPVFTTVLMAALIIFGLMSYRGLPVSDLPNVDYPTIQVSAGLPGGSPETMASSVATPLERQFSTIAGIDSMVSSSGQGSTQITLQFALDRSIDAAAQDVQAAIALAQRQLPVDMPTPPTYRKINPADQPFLYIALTSPTLPLSKLNDFGDTLIAPSISTLAGVAQVMVYGAQKYAVRIQVDPRELAYRNLGIDDVASAIQHGNVNLPTGLLSGDHRAVTIEANGQMFHAEDFRPLIVAYRNGAPVRLEQIGRVMDSVENDRAAAWYCTPEMQQRSIVLAVQKQPGSNTVAVAASVKNLLPLIAEALPASVSLKIIRDSSVPIQEAAHDVQVTLILTLFLVVLVIFVFLRSPTATIIPSLALPMSIIGTFAGMALLNYSLDNLSLMALTLAVGFVVDDAIVMLENIVRHMEMGKSRWQASLDGSREVAFTIVSMTISLAAVFLPVLFMGGLVGRLFREFAVTIGIAVLLSGAVSLSLTPLLCSRFLKDPKKETHGKFDSLFENFFQKVLAFYDRTLSWALENRRIVLGISGILLIGTVFLFILVPKGFLPSEDRGLLQVRTEASEGISYRALWERQQKLAAVVQQNPNVEAFMSAGGPGGPGGPGGNNGRMLIRLKPRGERDASADDVLKQLRGKMSTVPDIQAFIQNPPVIQIGGMQSKSLYQYTLQGADINELYRAAAKMQALMKDIPGLIDVTSDMLLKNPKLDVEIDRDLASSLGLTANQIETAMLNAYSSRQVSTIYAPENQYAVLLELLPEYQKDANALSWLYVRNAQGQMTPLQAVAHFKEHFGPVTVNHCGQLPAVTVSFNLEPGKAIGDVVGTISDLANKHLPQGISASFQGTAQAFQASMNGLWLLMLLAVLVIYMTLAILYENFWHPITILTALPFAGFGALLTLLIFNTELSLYAFVGLIMLVGLVKKNGIMMVDFAVEARRQEGKTAVEAIREACLIRFRPIMMTTVAALMAGLPIACGWGAGAESRRPLGLAVVGGLLFSQTLTLYVTPVFYVYMEKFQEFLARRKEVKALSTKTPIPDTEAPDAP